MSQSLNYAFILRTSCKKHIHVTQLSEISSKDSARFVKIMFLHLVRSADCVEKTCGCHIDSSVPLGRMLNQLEPELTSTSSKSILISTLSNNIKELQKKNQEKILGLKDTSLNVQGIMRTKNVICPIIVNVITLLEAKYLLRQSFFQFKVFGHPYN